HYPFLPGRWLAVPSLGLSSSCRFACSLLAPSPPPFLSPLPPPIPLHFPSSSTRSLTPPTHSAWLGWFLVLFYMYITDVYVQDQDANAARLASALGGSSTAEIVNGTTAYPPAVRLLAAMARAASAATNQNSTAARYYPAVQLFSRASPLNSTIGAAQGGGADVDADAPTRLSALLALAANGLLPFVIPDTGAGGANKRDRRALSNSQTVGRRVCWARAQPRRRRGGTQFCLWGEKRRTREGRVVGADRTADRCHADTCDPFPVRETARCWCGKHEKEVGCGEGEAVPCSLVEESWIGRFVCADSCDRLFACGVHLPCHPASGAPAPCPCSPENVRTCPCGPTPSPSPAPLHHPTKAASGAAPAARPPASPSPPLLLQRRPLPRARASPLLRLPVCLRPSGVRTPLPAPLPPRPLPPVPHHHRRQVRVPEWRGAGAETAATASSRAACTAAPSRATPRPALPRRAPARPRTHRAIAIAGTSAPLDAAGNAFPPRADCTARIPTCGARCGSILSCVCRSVPRGRLPPVHRARRAAVPVRREHPRHGVLCRERKGGGGAVRGGAARVRATPVPARVLPACGHRGVQLKNKGKKRANKAGAGEKEGIGEERGGLPEYDLVCGKVLGRGEHRSSVPVASPCSSRPSRAGCASAARIPARGRRIPATKTMWAVRRETHALELRCNLCTQGKLRSLRDIKRHVADKHNVRVPSEADWTRVELIVRATPMPGGDADADADSNSGTTGA
ncbi:hypothetical protein B0H14DRAFT_3556720, partial [Mycena olivaceomarginata]